MSVVRMRVLKYIPNKCYGFLLADGGEQVFFPLAVFDHGPFPRTGLHCKGCPAGTCVWTQTAPPPVLGEEVEVEMPAEIDPDPAKAPRALRVRRLTFPMNLLGIVECFDTIRGYGYVRGEDGVVYHLHRSEVLADATPRPTQQVMFYAGVRQSRPRACHVKVCP